MPEGSLHIRLDPSRVTPIYVQIMDQVRYHVARGTLQPEDELPSVRSLSGEHLINPNTVVRAYQELEREGLVYKKRGRGTYVSPRAATMVASERRRIVAEGLSAAVREARELGLSAAEVRQELDRLLSEPTDE
ncbi:GntR family transcriptional regulator, partial [Candidatus Latescibacterota bacterium]